MKIIRITPEQRAQAEADLARRRAEAEEPADEPRQRRARFGPRIAWPQKPVTGNEE